MLSGQLIVGFVIHFFGWIAAFMEFQFNKMEKTKWMKLTMYLFCKKPSVLVVVNYEERAYYETVFQQNSSLAENKAL